ncbi:uncharacterized protein LOC129337900 [Eublepharis macularius]|uniref:Uncharacterized protein LOC129336993 n=1 Tax=Eublepharis macularius TaxID=481883 RepID=A0AA97JY50_EUBMA|nr:uncharacterized protein LOC129336993 [Eublepharis macularius]XP_054847873.1 uncharacterized protein LOC129337900 [Eublepharis macularius]
MISRRHGNVWEVEEVSLLLRVVRRSGHASRLMASTQSSNRGIYRFLSRVLRSRGFHRTANQCRSKFQKLKSDFISSMEALQCIPRSSRRIRVHNAMMLIWKAAGRPRCQERPHDEIICERAVKIEETSSEDDENSETVAVESSSAAESDAQAYAPLGVTTEDPAKINTAAVPQASERERTDDSGSHCLETEETVIVISSGSSHEEATDDMTAPETIMPGDVSPQPSTSASLATHSGAAVRKYAMSAEHKLHIIEETTSSDAEDEDRNAVEEGRTEDAEGTPVLSFSTGDTSAGGLRDMMPNKDQSADIGEIYRSMVGIQSLCLSRMGRYHERICRLERNNRSLHKELSSLKKKVSALERGHRSSGSELSGDDKKN